MVLPGYAAAGLDSFEVADKGTVIESVTEMPGYGKEQIYTGTKTWIAETFQSAKAVIENDDKDAGTIIGNASVEFPCVGNIFSCAGKSDKRLQFTLRVDMKDQKFKVTLSNMTSFYPTGENMALWKHDIDEAARPALAKLGEQLKATIEKEKSSSNW
jgi:hypothetical protein